MKKISIIVAIARNYAIGMDNQLLWHISDDMKRFKKLTSGHTVIMGKTTFESLPVHPLPKRVNIVISDNPEDKFDGCITVHSIDEAVSYCKEQEESFVIGGGSIYRQFLPLADKLYVTLVHQDFDADTFFPEFDLARWKLLEREDHGPDGENDFSYSFLVFAK
jgi:dihydrofolate reductase